MKRLLVLAFVCLCLLSLACCNREETGHQERVQRGDVNVNTTDDAELAEAKLIVNGNDISEGNYVRIDYGAKNAHLPLTAVLKALGYDAELKYDEITDSYAVIIDDDTEFLNTQQEDFGFPMDAGDTDSVRRIVDDEIIIDSDAIFTVMYWGYFAEIEIDYSTNTVYINSHDPYASTTHDACLMVNGKDITKGSYVSILEFGGYTDAELPLLAVVEELGAQIEWQGETVVAVTYKGETRTYNTSEDDFGVYGPEGGVIIRRTENNDLIFDLSSIEEILKNVYGVTVSVDKENRTVHVDSVE